MTSYQSPHSIDFVIYLQRFVKYLLGLFFNIRQKVLYLLHVNHARRLLNIVCWAEFTNKVSILFIKWRGCWTVATI
jgi:hypothetical protein